MPTFLDCLLLALLIFPAIRGYRRGLVRSVLGVGRLLVVVLLTVALISPVADLLDKHLLSSPIKNAVGTRIDALVAQTEGGVEELYAALPASLRAYLTESDIAVPSVDAAAERWTDTISHAVSGALASVLSTLLVFVLASVALTFGLKLLSGIIHAVPIVAGLDRLLGLVAGVLTGVAIVALASRFLAPFLIAMGRPEWVEASWLLR